MSTMIRGCSEQHCGWSRMLRHEFGNMLAPILGHVQQLLREERDPQRRDRLLRVEALTREMARKLDGPGRGVGGSGVFTAVRLERIIGEALESWRAEQVETGPDFVVRWQGLDGTAQVVVDREAVVTLLVNLLRNASCHGRAGKGIRLVLGVREDRVEVAVEDGGPGVPGGDVERLPPGYTTRSGEGHGQGLRLASEIAGLHGSRLRSERVDAKTHRVFFTLPLLEPVPAVSVGGEVGIGRERYSAAGA